MYNFKALSCLDCSLRASEKVQIRKKAYLKIIRKETGKPVELGFDIYNKKD